MDVPHMELASSKEWHPCLSYLVGILNWTNRSNVNGFPLYPILSGEPTLSYCAPRGD